MKEPGGSAFSRRTISGSVSKRLCFGCQPSSVWAVVVSNQSDSA